MSKEIIRPAQFARVSRALNTENIVQITDAQREELATLYQGTLEKMRPGFPTTGKIVRIDPQGVVVDVGYKSDGVISRFEFSDSELKSLAPGAELEVILDELEGANGTITLSYEKAKALRAWDSIMELFNSGKPVEGTVTHKVKGGLAVDIGGVTAFMPGSQVDLQRVADFDQFVGQVITADIIKINKKRGNVIVSRRKFLSDQRAEARRKVLDTVSENQVIDGVVKNITNYGVFVDIGGVDGLLHITDMTWGRIAHPSEIVKIGQSVTVKVLTIDKENNKISLGMKQLAGNPWEQLAEAIQPGMTIQGTIASITDYGLFIEIQKGVEGLVHISEVSWTERINDLIKHFKIGQPIDVLVLSIDKENRRMSLSIKQLRENPWATIKKQFTVGQRVSGTVTNITDFGVFIQLIPGVDGLAHVSDLSWTEHVEHPSNRFKKGDAVDAIILEIDEEKKKISLGIKQLEQDPWELAEQEYPTGTIVEGEVTKLAPFGAFVKLPNGVEGLVHISEAGDQSIEQALPVGSRRSFRVLTVNKDERRVSLSTRLEAAPGEFASGSTTGNKKRATENRKARSEPQAKPKSQLQLELERHAQRSQSSDTDTE